MNSVGLVGAQSEVGGNFASNGNVEAINVQKFIEILKTPHSAQCDLLQKKQITVINGDQSLVVFTQDDMLVFCKAACAIDVKEAEVAEDSSCFLGSSKRKYTGKMVDGKPHGSGEVECLEEGYPYIKYKGGWKGGVFQGKGEMILVDRARVVKGSWDQGLLCEGTIRMGETYLYKGALNSFYEPHGFGEETKEFTKDRMKIYVDYKGNFQNGKYHGIGKVTIQKNFTTTLNRIEKRITEKYDGDYLKGVRHGSGTLKTYTYHTSNDYGKETKKEKCCFEQNTRVDTPTDKVLKMLCLK